MAKYGHDNAILGNDYRSLQSILIDDGIQFGGSNYGVSSILFDNLEELLWTGSESGHVTSYTSPDLQKYTSLQIRDRQEVRSLIPLETGILSLTSNHLHMTSRRGLHMFEHSSDKMQDMQCMVLEPSGRLIMGGHQENIIEFDLEFFREQGLVKAAGGNCAILRNHPSLICSGSTDGKVALHDPNTLEVRQLIDTDFGLLSDFDVHGDLLVTCGYSTVRTGGIAVDEHVKVFDLRAMKFMSNIQAAFPPYLLRFIHAYTSRLCVVSQSGEFQMVDTANSSYSPFVHRIGIGIGTANISSFDVSPSCQALAFGDGDGYLNLHGSCDEINFNQHSRAVEYADSVVPLHPIAMDDQLTFFSNIPMPVRGSEELLSNWPHNLCQREYRYSSGLDSEIKDSMKMVGSIGYAPNSGGKLRNQVTYEGNSRPTTSFHDKPSVTATGSVGAPSRYLKQDIKYSRSEDAEISRFNRSVFSGLEANLPNSYCNNMIQVLYFIEPLRCALLSHLCQLEFCLACELGFLFHMLDTAYMPCQASNFLRAFRTCRKATAHELVITDLYEAKKQGKLQNLVQNWTRFILQQIHTGLQGNVEPNIKLVDSNIETIMNQLFGAKMFTSNRCRCKTETYQETTMFSVQLLYPDSQPGAAVQQFPFEEIVQRSLSPHLQTNAYCEACKKFTSMVQKKLPKTLPDILVLTCGDNKKDSSFWETQQQFLTKPGATQLAKDVPVPYASTRKRCRYGLNCTRGDCRYYHDLENFSNLSLSKVQNVSSESSSWIPLRLKLALKNNEVTVENCCRETDENLNQASSEEMGHVVLELTAVVSVILDNPDSNKDNIVSCVKVGPNYHKRRYGDGVSQWYLFNDFSVTPINEEEAVYLNFDWKLPSVLYYSRIDLDSRHSNEVVNPFKEQVFQDEDNTSLTSGNAQLHVNFMPLSKDNFLHDGQVKIVAIDAEFVTLNQEESEIRSDGTRSTVRPPHLGIARISCVRGEGPFEGFPFIDDYISTNEQIVDYLTAFSGIQPGDLDANISSKHLVPLKTTYQKLRYLLDSGVIFLGHGLKNDFRVINLVVPRERIIDTVYLFQLPNQRMVSLQFLAWHFLGIKIQAETHDSVEDAKTALQLYKKYVELKDAGTLTDALNELYKTGKPLSWKVPGIENRR